MKSKVEAIPCCAKPTSNAIAAPYSLHICICQITNTACIELLIATKLQAIFTRIIMLAPCQHSKAVLPYTRKRHL